MPVARPAATFALAGLRGAPGSPLGMVTPPPCPRVVDGIEDNGGTSEPQTFCFNVDPPLQSAARDSPTSGTSGSSWARPGALAGGLGGLGAPPPPAVSSPAGTDAGGPALAMEAEEIKQNIKRLNQEVWRGRSWECVPKSTGGHSAAGHPPGAHPPLPPVPDQPPQPGGFPPQPGAAAHDGAAPEPPGRPAALPLPLPPAHRHLSAPPALTPLRPGAPLAPACTPQLPQLPLRQPPGQTLPRPQPLGPRRRQPRHAPLGGRRGAVPAAGGHPQP